MNRSAGSLKPRFVRLRGLTPLAGAVLALSGCHGPELASVPANPPSEKPSRPAAPIEPSSSVAKPSPAEITSISIDRLFPLIQSGRVLIIDARPSIIHRFGHLPGSLNVPRLDAVTVVRRMNDMWVAARNEGRPIVVYCTNQACPDAFAVASAIAALGHACSVYEGGWEEWKSAGLPVE